MTAIARDGTVAGATVGPGGLGRDARDSRASSASRWAGCATAAPLPGCRVDRHGPRGRGTVAAASWHVRRPRHPAHLARGGAGGGAARPGEQAARRPAVRTGLCLSALGACSGTGRGDNIPTLRLALLGGG